MRRILGTLLLLLALSGCGSDTGISTSDTGTPRDTQTATETSEPRAEVVEIVSETAAGGETGGPAVRVDRPAGMARLTRDFRTPGLEAEIRSVVQHTSVVEGQGLYAAVIAVGCDVPPSASVEVTDGKVVITAGKIVKPMPECLAPVTSVAIALIDLPLS